jgi:hypothetical protein
MASQCKGSIPLNCAAASLTKSYHLPEPPQSQRSNGMDEEAQQVRTQVPQVKEQRTNSVLSRSAGRQVVLQQNTNHHEQDERPREEKSDYDGVTQHLPRYCRETLPGRSTRLILINGYTKANVSEFVKSIAGIAESIHK